ncbi:DUF459 domain-containing protein [Roseovarius sp. SYSU LYC5161]|uniref:SGNH/GDSL hydrolase family protein n=1 Tax=Roseovarius halophilus (ex Wu et al. 2025) TaxID=3376060 RepID=UPI0039998F7E
MRAGLLPLVAAALLAACGPRGDGASAQDMGALLSGAEPDGAAIAQTGTEIRATVSRDNPARMLVIGDSLAQGFGMLLQQRAPARGLAIEVTNRGRPSTGLARGDYYDWPARLGDMIGRMDPDIVVAHFGANDMQTVITSEGRTGYGTAGWEDAYRAQMRRVLALAAEHDIIMYWFGPGPDGNAALNAHLGRINPWFKDESARAGATYFPITPFTTPPDGRFARRVEVNGRTMAMRTADGSHFTGAGYQLVADRLLDAVIARFPALAPADRQAPGGGLVLAGMLQ